MSAPKNIVIVVVDALRFDCLSCESDRRYLKQYGVDRIVETAEIDEVAKRGTRFSQAIAVTPYTSASVASIFTGLYPSRHEIRASYYTKMSSRVRTVAEMLKEKGYRTFQILDLANQLNPTEVTRGIDHRFLTSLEPDESDMLFQALTENRDEKTFLFAYFLDVNNPYGYSHAEPFDGYNEAYYADLDLLQKQFLPEGLVEDRKDRYYTWCKVKQRMFGGQHRDEIVQRYVQGVNKFSRGRFSWFMKRLQECGVMENALLIITADHGEGDYGFDFTHGGDLREDVVRVPLIMSYPGVLPEGKVITSQVSQVDITPTVLDLAGMGQEEDFDGRSLVPLIEGSGHSVGTAYSEGWGYQWERVRKFLFAEGLSKNLSPPYEVFLRQRSLRNGQYKYIVQGEENNRALEELNREILVKWACRNIYFRHENEKELKHWWEELSKGNLNEDGLVRAVLSSPDAKSKHLLFDHQNDPFEKKNLLEMHDRPEYVTEAIKLQDGIRDISRRAESRTIYIKSLYSNIEQNDNEKLRNEAVLASRPLKMLTDLTSNCNIHCQICYRNYRSREENEFRLDWFRDLSGLFGTLRELQLSSDGEPFMYKHISEVLDTLEEFPHLFTVAVSNGTLIGKSGLRERIVRSIKRLGISFDGASRETYESIRRGSSYEKVIENIKLINNLKKCEPTSLLEIIFHFVPIHRNIRELPALVELADSLDIRLITAKHLGIINDAMSEALQNECMYYHQDLYDSALTKARERAGQLGVALDFPPLYGAPGGEQGEAEESLKACFEPWESVYISTKGNVKACCGSGEVFGNLDEQSFEEIWNSIKYQELRQRVNSPDPLPMCRTCTSAGVRGRREKTKDVLSYYRYDRKEASSHDRGDNGGGEVITEPLPVDAVDNSRSDDKGNGSVQESSLALKSAIWFLTWKCNNRCPYCWEVQRQARGEFVPEDFIASERWVEAWNRLKPETLDISGGEPWLQPGFIEMIDGFDESVRVAITTNATKDLTQFVQKISPEKVFSMTLSFHPSQRMSTDIFLGKCLLLKNRGFHITVNFVTWPEQMWLIPSYKQFFENYGLRFHVDPYAATAYNPYTFSDTEKEFLREYVGADRAHWFGEVEKYPVLCSGGLEHLNVQPNGDAFRCINDKILNKGKVGNVLDHDFHLNVSWTRCDDYHRCPGCDKDKIQTKRLEGAKQGEKSKPLSYTL